jgi:hypothetical protein
MKKIYALPALSLLFLLSACREKDTVINGRVIDKHTGAPIPEVRITFAISHGEPGLHAPVTVFSGENGQFSAPQMEGATGIEVFEMKKAGYLGKGGGNKVVDINQGAVNDVEIFMIPIDGILKIEIENLTGQQDTVYFGLYSEITYSEKNTTLGYVSPPQPSLPFGLGQTYKKYVSLPSGEYALIYWSFYRIPYPARLLDYAPFRDSILILKGDTTSLKISL